MAGGEEGHCALRQHSRRRVVHQLHGESSLVRRSVAREVSCMADVAEKMYTRASASDYDDFQAKGWTTKELLPLMKKHETYQRASHNRFVSYSPTMKI